MSRAVEILNQENNVSCYEVLGSVDEAMRNILGARRYYVVGGTASEALRDPATAIDEQSAAVYAKESSNMPVTRPDGTTRDIDIVIEGPMTKRQGKHVKAAVSEAIDNKMLVSLFPFKNHDPTMSPLHRAVEFSTVGLVERTVDVAGKYRFEMYPLEQEVPKESYDPWAFVLPSGKTVPMLHPAGHVLSYGLRSISGVRHKDAAKVTDMWKRVGSQFEEEIREGKFQNWVRFIDLKAKVAAGGKKLSGDIVLDETIRQASDRSLQNLKHRSKALVAAERHPEVVRLAQQGSFQRLLNVFVRTS